jgi:hypothetical protein
MPWRTKVLVSGGVAIAILALYPRQETVAPDWHINVTDDSGRPLAGIKITEVWQDYTVERNSHEDSHVTDADGHLVFTRHAMRVPAIWRIFGAARNIVSEGAHASFGPLAYLVVDYPAGYGNNDANEFGNNEARWFGGHAVTKQAIVLHRCKNGLSGVVCMQ